jgi:hypothetical protein
MGIKSPYFDAVLSGPNRKRLTNQPGKRDRDGGRKKHETIFLRPIDVPTTLSAYDTAPAGDSKR